MTSKPKSVLMISTKLDPHVDAVLEILQDRGVPCFRLNTDHFHEIQDRDDRRTVGRHQAG